MVSKDYSNESIDSVSGGGDQIQVNVDEANVAVSYSSTVRVTAQPEEFTLDFAGPMRATGPKTAVLKIDNRVVLNPYTAKRLAMTLGQAVARHEQMYGPLELDPRKRMVNP